MPETRKEPPKRIWLQWHGADKDDMTEEEARTPAPEILWCEDKIFDTDVEYVRVGSGRTEK